jgi:heme oxygenase (biliverdin-IX-beta and delta-forming)
MMSRLREKTARQHIQLEDAVEIEQRFQSPAAYRELVEIFYGFVRPIEMSLAQHDWSQAGLDFTEREKAALLERDLLAVGSSPEAVDQCMILPDVSSIDRAFGALYVMEGSTLGGQHISRLATQRGIGLESLNYFKSYGFRVGEMWKSFGDALNRFAETRGDSEEIVSGAQDTFESLRGWFLSKLAVS